jgi:hypothetical protein
MYGGNDVILVATCYRGFQQKPGLSLVFFTPNTHECLGFVMGRIFVRLYWRIQWDSIHPMDWANLNTCYVLNDGSTVLT